MGINESLFERAQKTIPGGVNSPVRAFKSVGGAPRFIERAKGAYMWDAEGKRFIDYIGSWGPMILGHNHPAVIEAVHQAVDNGLSFGAVTEGEIAIAEEVVKIMPNIDEVRLVSSGTEAGMSAIRLARGFTGRNKIIKFEGCYHGHSDSLLVKAGSGMLTFGNPSSAGVPAGTTEIVSGGAVGVDRCARKYANQHGLKLTEFLPDYETYGKYAPLKRNLQIIEYADVVYAFWDGKSTGTSFVIENCHVRTQ